MKDSDILLAYNAMLFHRGHMIALQDSDNQYDRYRRGQLIAELNDAIDRTELLVNALIKNGYKT